MNDLTNRFNEDVVRIFHIFALIYSQINASLEIKLKKRYRQI